jgi:hypothetical protein
MRMLGALISHGITVTRSLGIHRYGGSRGALATMMAWSPMHIGTVIARNGSVKLSGESGEWPGLTSLSRQRSFRPNLSAFLILRSAPRPHRAARSSRENF